MAKNLVGLYLSVYVQETRKYGNGAPSLSDLG